MFKDIFHSTRNTFWELYERFLWTHERWISFLNRMLSNLQIWLFAKLPWSSDTYYREYLYNRHLGVDYSWLVQADSYLLEELWYSCEELVEHRKEDVCSWNRGSCEYKPHKNGKGTKVHPNPDDYSNKVLSG